MGKAAAGDVVRFPILSSCRLIALSLLFYFIFLYLYFILVCSLGGQAIQDGCDASMCVCVCLPEKRVTE